MKNELLHLDTASPFLPLLKEIISIAEQSSSYTQLIAETRQRVKLNNPEICVIEFTDEKQLRISENEYSDDCLVIKFIFK